VIKVIKADKNGIFQIDQLSSSSFIRLYRFDHRYAFFHKTQHAHPAKLKP
jgi:hypothetical protein